MRKESIAWAVLIVSQSRLDGHRTFLAGRHYFTHAMPPSIPTAFDGYTRAVFRTRQAARDAIKVHFRYLALRPDLRKEPHGWRMPRPVKVRVTVETVEIV